MQLELSIVMMLFPLLEEEQLRVFLLFHILPRRFFFPQLLPYKRMLLKVMWKPPLSIFKYNLNIICLTLPSHLLQYPLHGKLTAIPSPSSYLL